MFVISTDSGAVFWVPMKSRFMSACAVEFVRGVNYVGGMFYRVLENYEPLLHT